MKRRFFDHAPNTWEDLEAMVHQAFVEMGYEAERGVKIETVRGAVAVDVHAVKTSTPIPTQVLCECKHWNKQVPQSVVHGFRTVVADAGAHFGLIISKKGFQAGAERSRSATNVHLMDFDAFQETYFGEWLSGASLLLSRMNDQVLPIWRAQMGEKEWGLDVVGSELLEGIDPFNKYQLFHGIAYSNHFVYRNDFPAAYNDPRGDPKVIKEVTINSHREFLEIAKSAVAECIDRFSIPEKYVSKTGQLLIRPPKD